MLPETYRGYLQVQREARAQDLKGVISEIGLAPAHLSRVVSWATPADGDVRAGNPLTLGDYIAANSPDETLRAFGLERPAESITVRRIDQLNEEELQQVAIAEFQGVSDDFTINGMNREAILRRFEAGVAGDPIVNSLVAHFSLIEDLADAGSIAPPKEPNS